MTCPGHQPSFSWAPPDREEISSPLAQVSGQDLEEEEEEDGSEAEADAEAELSETDGQVEVDVAADERLARCLAHGLRARR